jgi:hypothetical protein
MSLGLVTAVEKGGAGRDPRRGKLKLGLPPVTRVTAVDLTAVFLISKASTGNLPPVSN